MTRTKPTCKACNNILFGVKTRLAVEHTCSDNPVIIRKNIEEAEKQRSEMEEDKKIQSYYNHL